MHRVTEKRRRFLVVLLFVLNDMTCCQTSLDDLDFLTSALPEDVPAEQEKVSTLHGA